MTQVVTHCAGLLFEPFGEVPAQRLIVELQHEPSQQDVAEEQSHGHRPALREGELMLPYPGVEEVHEGVVHHVERVGDISQEFAHAGSEFVACFARRAHVNQNRKYYDNGYRFIQAVRPKQFAIADMRQR